MFPVKNIGIGVCIAMIILAGGLLRFYQLGDQSLWIDEGYSINAAQAVLERGLPVMDSGEWYKKGQADVYSIALSMYAFGFDAFDPWPARIPAALFGTLSIAAAALLSRRLFGSHAITVSSSILMALSTWEISWSRQARGYAGMQFFILLSLYLLTGWFRNRRRGHLLGGLSCLGISALFHPAALVVAFPLGAMFMIDGLKRRGLSFNKALAISLGGVMAAALASILFVPGSTAFKITGIPVSYLATTYPFLIASALGAVIWASISRKFKAETYSLALIILISTIFLSVYPDAMERRYILSIFPLILILVAAFSAQVVSISNLKKDHFVTAASLVLLLIIGYGNMTFLPRSHYKLEQGSPQPDFKEAYRYINDNKEKDDIILSSYTHLNKIYTGSSGYWLAIGLRGDEEDVEKGIIRGYDFYTDAPTIGTLEDIREIMTTRSGYVIIDTLSYMRLGKEKIKAIVDLKKETVHKTGDLNTRIFIYRF